MVEENLSPENVVPITGSTELFINLKKGEKRPCCEHKKVNVDPETRTVECDECGFVIHPFEYLLHWAQAGDRRLEGLKHIEAQRAIAERQLQDLERKIKNARGVLKRSGAPQPENERRDWDRMMWNPLRIASVENNR